MPSFFICHLAPCRTQPDTYLHKMPCHALLAIATTDHDAIMLRPITQKIHTLSLYVSLNDGEPHYPHRHQYYKLAVPTQPDRVRSYLRLFHGSAN